MSRLRTLGGSQESSARSAGIHSQEPGGAVCALVARGCHPSPKSTAVPRHLALLLTSWQSSPLGPPEYAVQPSESWRRSPPRSLLPDGRPGLLADPSTTSVVFSPLLPARLFVASEMSAPGMAQLLLPMDSEAPESIFELTGKLGAESVKPSRVSPSVSLHNVFFSALSELRTGIGSRFSVLGSRFSVLGSRRQLGGRADFGLHHRLVIAFTTADYFSAPVALRSFVPAVSDEPMRTHQIPPRAPDSFRPPFPHRPQLRGPISRF